MPRISDFSEAEEQYLVSRHPDFRRTPSSAKEAFREECAMHIIRTRNLVLDDPYVKDLFVTKVRNWFQNNAPVKKTRLPIKINHSFTGERVYGMLNQEEIRLGLLESRPANVAADAPHIVVWNAKRKELWNTLRPEQKAGYERLAVQWSEEGPDDDLKPEMAERRAVSWMKAVTLMFWLQCRMPIFIYGCFEDTHAQLQGATFDTSLLFEDTEEGKGKPTFRQSKEWATDFRRYFYEYFTPHVRPDLASPDAMEYLRTKSKKVVEPFEFEATDEGWPLLPRGTDMTHPRRQEVLRLWFKELYDLACGREVVSVPWSSIMKKPGQFFAAGMLPPGFPMDDPSHIRRQDVIDFYDHVDKIQNPSAATPADAPPRFQFSNLETGPENERRYPEAINSGDVEPWQPRRAKKKVPPPTFDAPPGATDAEGDDEDEGDGDEAPRGAKRSSGRGMFNPGPKFYKDMKRIKRENDRAKARNAKAKAKAKAKTKKSKGATKRRRGKGKGKANASVDSDEEIWDTEDEGAEEEEFIDFDALDNDVPEEDTDETDDDEGRPRQAPIGQDSSDDSGDEVEETLERYEDVLSSSAAREKAPPSAGPSRIAADSSGPRRAFADSASASRGQRSHNVNAPQPRVPSSPDLDAGSVVPTGVGSLAPSKGAAPPVPAPATDVMSLPAMEGPATPAAGPSQPEHSSTHAPLGSAHLADFAVADTAWNVPVGTHLAPADVPPDGPSRFVYLKSLDSERAYVEMLDRGRDLLIQTSSIRVKPPLFWASWGYQSPFLPKECHVGDKAAKALQGVSNFLRKGLKAGYGAMEAQRYCLVMGIALRNVMALQTIEPDGEWPAELPRYMEASALSFEMRQPLLDLCNSVFRTATSPAAEANPRREGKATDIEATTEPVVAAAAMLDVAEARRRSRRGAPKTVEQPADQPIASGSASANVDEAPKKATRRSMRLKH